MCPELFYCPEGTQLALACPNGYWTPWKAAESENDCITCPRGKWCNFSDMRANAAFMTWMKAQLSHDGFVMTDIPNVHLNQFWGDCANGYICLEGATTPTPNSPSDGGGYPCPIGHYCPAGVIVEMPCKPGTYQDQTLQSSCKPCPAGFYCPYFAMETPSEDFDAGFELECTEGYYCPQGSIYPTPCPAGTFNSPAGSDDDGDCDPCTATYYCDIVGQIAEADICADGYICTGGDARPASFNDIVTMSGSTATSSGQCPIGYSCTAGEADPIECISTTY